MNTMHRVASAWAVVAMAGFTLSVNAEPFINEIRIEQLGADVDEYFELMGDAGESLDGLTYLVIGDGAAELGSGVLEAVVGLDGLSIPDDGFFFAAEDDDTAGELADLITGLSFENSDNVTHLLVRDFTGSNGDDLDMDDNGVLDEPFPWSSVLDLIALVEEDNPPKNTEFHYGPPAVGPIGGFVPAHVFRFPDGGGSRAVVHWPCRSSRPIRYPWFRQRSRTGDGGAAGLGRPRGHPKKALDAGLPEKVIEPSVPSGLAPWNGRIGAIHGGRGRSRLNRVVRLDLIVV